MVTTQRVTQPGPGLPPALVVGAGAATLHEAARVLETVGFTTRTARVLAGEPVSAVIPGAAGLLVLLQVARPAAMVDAVRDLGKRHPSLRIVAAMSRDAGNALLRKALRAGAAGLLAEDDIAVALGATALAVAAGQLVVPATLLHQLTPRPLSHREKQVLGLVVMGFTNRQIADKLYLAESTVKTHLSSAFSKLHARSRSEATALILDPDEGYGLGILSIAGAQRASAV
jgi:DNA-binding NarL/FixJ family response regulator